MAKNPRRHLTQEEKWQICRLMEKGLPRREIARYFGISEAAVDFWRWKEKQQRRKIERSRAEELYQAFRKELPDLPEEVLREVCKQAAQADGFSFDGEEYRWVDKS
jgi:IS30 family transposase